MKEYRIFRKEGSPNETGYNWYDDKHVLKITTNYREVLDLIYQYAIDKAKDRMRESYEIDIRIANNDNACQEISAGVDCCIVTDHYANHAYYFGFESADVHKVKGNAYDGVIYELTQFIGLCGHAGEIHTFDLCSDYGIELEGSTIDKIVIDGNHILFYYNENTGDFDSIYHFDVINLFKFLRELKTAIIARNS